ncbi:MAG: peptidylprolyl isomerase [Gemmatimonadetes bacterium]|nr:peptidylprolyl isomerase [Gemmatimonadota bacterium]
MTAMGDRVLKRARYLKIGLIICLIGMWGCEKPQKVSIVAQVGNRHLTKEALERRIPPPFAGTISPKEKQRLVEDWIEEELLYREAIRQELDQDPELSERIDRAVRQLLASELMARTHARDAEVSEDEILTYYEEHRADFERDQLELRVRHLIVADRNAQTRAWNRLQKGEFFEQVAREVSIDQSAVNGGDLGYFTEDMVTASFWAACREAKLGHRIRTRTELGYHIIEVMARDDEGSIRDLIDVRGEIQQRILTERRREQRAKLLTELKERSEWSVDWKQLNRTQ